MIAVDELGILADDLTGACDVAACFARRLGHVRVAIDARTAPFLLRDERGMPIVLNTQSRTLPPEESRACLAAAAPRWRESRRIVKKIDAALRGPVGAELEGLASVLTGWSIVLAPALPSIGRTTENGRQLDRGIPIDKTDYAADPLSPILTSDLSAAVLATGSVRVCVKDARTMEDLRRIVQGHVGSERVVFVGSLGLADAVADELTLPQHAAPARAVGRPGRRAASARSKTSPRVLVVCGSQYPRAATQIQKAVEDRHAVCCTISQDSVPPCVVPEREGCPSIIRLAPARLEPDGVPPAGPASTRLATTALAPTGPALPESSPQGAAARDQVASLFDLLADSVLAFRPEALALVGGETAYQLLTRLGVRSLEVHGRMDDVISFGTICDGALAGIRFCMKGGSVGAEDAVIAMIDHLRATEAVQ